MSVSLSFTRRALLVTIGILVAVTGLVLAPQSAHATTGADRFLAGQVYRGEFGAPSVLLVGRTYYAFATNADGHNLPAMHSRDLTTWYARSAYVDYQRYSTWKGYNDAFPSPARWAYYTNYNGRKNTRIWAPSVAHIGNQYVLAYAVAVSPTKMCLSIATAKHPMGPYTDNTTGPIVCSKDPQGTIDPQLFSVDGKHWWLIWKNSGKAGSYPSKVWTRRLTPDGLHLAPHTRAHFLLQTAQRWEGNVVEAPAMIKYKGRFYLFYSGNKYLTAHYAIGYAICRGPAGPCHRPQHRPLLATGGSVAGPGAQTPFVDKHGRLRLAYSAWDRGHVGYPKTTACLQTSYGCNQRRLHIGMLGVRGNGTLRVVQRG